MLLFALLLILWLVVMAMCAVFFARTNIVLPASIHSIFDTCWRQFGRLANKPLLCGTLIFAAVIVLRLAALPILPQPEPGCHDEFSYILGADTFASGRVTNPPHPMWEFFETEHVLFKPTYSSKYPPAQALVMALGLRLGHCWYGVLFSFAAMCTAIYWAARAYIPPRWALLVGLLPFVTPSITSYWCNSYWGGAVAGTGAALVYGACARLVRRLNIKDSAILGVGLALLANSRPFEGLVCITLPMLWLLASVVYKKRLKPSVVRYIVAPALVLATAAAGTLYYNYAVTGNALTMPHIVYHTQYELTPMWKGKPLYEEPVYHNQQLKDFWTKMDVLRFKRLQTPAGWLDSILNEYTAGMFAVYVGLWLMPFAISSPLSVRDKRMRVMWGSLAALTFAMFFEIYLHYFQRHYFAPISAAMYILLVQGIRHLRFLRVNNRRVGLALARLALLTAAIGFVANVFSLPYQRAIYDREQQRYPRARIAREMEARPGKQLVIVHFAEGHDPGDEYVYNRADIDNAKVVWAREFDPEKQKQLLDYYPDRKVWVLDVDASPTPRLYTLQESKKAVLTKSVNSDSWMK